VRNFEANGGLITQYNHKVTLKTEGNKN
jgi:hypothetical protein